MKMKRLNLGYSLFLLVGLLLAPMTSSAQVVQGTKTMGDYDVSASSWVGGYVSVQNNGDGTFTLTAVELMGSFKGWTDGVPQSTKSRVVRASDYVSDVNEDEFILPFEAKFDYTVTYCNTCGDFDVWDGESFTKNNDTIVTESDRGYIKAVHVGDNCWQLFAEGKSRPAGDPFVFAQWSDGDAQNPRTIDLIEDDTVTYYATFIEPQPLGVVESWALNHLKVTTFDSQNALGSIGSDRVNVVVFYDGKLAGLSSPCTTIEYGTYQFVANYTSAAELAGKKCHIVYKDSDCIPYATLDTIIPYLVSATEEVAVVPSDVRYGVHVLENGVATFADAQNIADLDIYAGGKAIINAAVSATSVALRANPADFEWYGTGFAQSTDAAELLVATGGSLANANSNTIYYDCMLDYADYYPLSLPATVNTSAVTYRSGADAADHFGLDIYDGDSRAQGKRGWEYDYFNLGESTGHQPITVGRGYNIFADPILWMGQDVNRVGILRFPMTINLSSGPMAAKTIEVELNDNGGAASNANKNWNLIGLPYLSSYSGTIEMLDGLDNVLDDLNYITYSEDNFRTYNTTSPSEFEMKPFNAYFVQVVDGTAKLRFLTPVEGRTYAPRRATANSKLRAGLLLTQGDKSDRTGLLFSDRYTNNYDINADLTKMLGNNQGLSLFSLSGAQKQAFIALPFADATETVIPLGYSKATVGEDMTFAIDEARYPGLRDDERIEALNLIDNVEGTTTNLLLDSYTCTAYEAADNERFVLAVRHVKNATNVTTDLCEEQAKPTKMRDGIYDLMGRRISDADARTLGAGVYIIISNGVARKEVIR